MFARESVHRFRNGRIEAADHQTDKAHQVPAQRCGLADFFDPAPVWFTDAPCAQSESAPARHADARNRCCRVLINTRYNAIRALLICGGFVARGSELEQRNQQLDC